MVMMFVGGVVSVLDRAGFFVPAQTKIVVKLLRRMLTKIDFCGATGHDHSDW